MKNRLFILVSISLIFFLKGNSQDIHFSQYLQAPLLINPATAGMSVGKHRANLNYKSQWSALGSLYKTMAASYDTRILKANNSKGGYLGIGLSIFNDKAGDANMAHLQGNLALSAVVKFKEYSTLSIALQGGFCQRKINCDNLKWGAQYDGSNYNSALSSTENYGNNSYNYFDLSPGVLWQYRKDKSSFGSGKSIAKVDIGGAVQHVNKPKLNFLGNNEVLKMKFVFHFNAEVDLPNEKFSIIPSFVYTQQGTLNEIIVGSVLKYYLNKKSARYTGFGKNSNICLGLQYRYKDAFIPMVMYQMGDYALGFSYDINTSSLNNASHFRGGAEFSFTYLLGYKSASLRQF